MHVYNMYNNYTDVEQCVMNQLNMNMCVKHRSLLLSATSPYNIQLPSSSDSY